MYSLSQIWSNSRPAFLLQCWCTVLQTPDLAFFPRLSIQPLRYGTCVRLAPTIYETSMADGPYKGSEPVDIS